MRLIGPTLLQKYSQRIVNIHPSLLPSFPGKDAIGQAFDAGVKETGVTVHYVDDGMDTGPVIAQKAVPILEGIRKTSFKKGFRKWSMTYIRQFCRSYATRNLLNGGTNIT